MKNLCILHGCVFVTCIHTLLLVVVVLDLIPLWYLEVGVGIAVFVLVRVDGSPIEDTSDSDLAL